MQVTSYSAPRAGRVPHQCLRVAEIQALIFKSLTQLDCVDLARTCSWFYEEAMNVVWADVSSLVPFAKCMPSDIIDETERWNCFTIDFRRQPTASDWRAFCKHTHRVRKFQALDTLHWTSWPKTARGELRPNFPPRSFDFTTDTKRAIASFVIERYNTGIGGSGLFPRLTTLKTHVVGDHWIPAYLPYVCGDTLQSFSASSGLTRPSESASRITDGIDIPFVETLPIVCARRWPRIKFVELRHMNCFEANPIDVHIEEIVLWLKGFTQLSHLEIAARCHSSLVQILSEMSFLHTLKFWDCANSAPHTTDLDFPSCSSRFQSLRELTLSCISEPDTPVPLLQALDGSRTLTTLDLSLFDERGSLSVLKQAPTIFEAISHLPALESLEFGCYCDPRALPYTAPEVPPLDTSLFRNLLHLRNLRHLKIKGFLHILITDRDLREAARAWPSLEDIQLRLFDPANAPCELEQTPDISLAGVQALYNGCPSLNMIDLPVCDIIPLTVDAPPLRLHAATRESTLENLILAFYCLDGKVVGGSDKYIPMLIRLMLPRVQKLKTTRLVGEDRYPRPPANDWWDERVERNWGCSYRHMELEKVYTLLKEMLKGLWDSKE